MPRVFCAHLHTNPISAQYAIPSATGSSFRVPSDPASARRHVSHIDSRRNRDMDAYTWFSFPTPNLSIPRNSYARSHALHILRPIIVDASNAKLIWQLRRLHETVFFILRQQRNIVLSCITLAEFAYWLFSVFLLDVGTMPRSLAEMKRQECRNAKF